MPAKTYFAGVYGDRFSDLGNATEDIKDFLVQAMMSIISEYLNPEISAIGDMQNLSAQNFMQAGNKEREIKTQIVNALS
jgi:hypothetical protein